MTEEASNPWAAIVGRCFTVASMACTLGMTEAAVVEAGHSLRLLMLYTADDVLLFPSFELHHGQAVDGLTEILRILQTGANAPWTWAQWLNTELPGEDPPRNITLLYEGRLNKAIRNATHDAWAWKS